MPGSYTPEQLDAAFGGSTPATSGGTASLDQYDPIFQAAGKQYNVDPKLLKAVAYTESRGDPDVVSGKRVSSTGAIGLMQFMPETAKSYGIDPTDPSQAIPAAAKYIAGGLDKHGSVGGALLEYAGGPNQAIWGQKTLGYPALIAQNYGKVSAPTSAAPTAPSAPSGAPQMPSRATGGLTPEQLDAAFGAPAKTDAPQPAAAASTAAPSAPATPAADAPNVAFSALPARLNPNANHVADAQAGLARSEAANAGVVQGVEDIPRGLIKTENYVLPKLGIGHPVDLPFQQDTENRLAQYGNQPNFGVGRFVGNTAVTLPVMGGLGKVAGAAGDALTGVLPEAQGAVDFLSGASQGGKLLSYGSRGVNGALQGAAATPLLAATSDASLPDQLKANMLFGGAAGAGIPAAIDAGKAIGNKLTVGDGINPLRAELAQKALDYGIPIRGSQITDSPLIKTADSVLSTTPLTGFAKQNSQQREAFTRAVSNTIGEDTPAITPDVMQAAKTRIGGVMNDVAARTDIQAGNELGDHLGSILDDAKQVLPDSEIKPLQTQVDNILGKVNEGVLPGTVYQALTRKGAPLDRAMASSDPNISHYAGRVRDALDDALERSASPEDLAALQKARLQYKNMKTIEPLVVKGAPGEISPVALNGRVNASFGNRAYSGAGQLGDLADIGQTFLKEPPNSGTEQRNYVRNLLTRPFAVAAEGGAAGALAMAHPLAAAGLAGGAAAGLGTSKLAASALGSDWYRNMLLRGVVNNGAAEGIAGNAVNRLIPAGIAYRQLSAGVAQ